jgi:adenylate kinase family enzyme
VKKVLVIGSGGAGKSTFSRRLGGRLGLEVIHLDTAFWRPGWQPTPKDEWARKVEELIRRESWVMDGNFSGTLEKRLAACDTVVFLDLPRIVCVWRALKRRMMYRNTSRPDMAEGCREKFDLEFLLWVWNYPTRSRPKVLALLEKYAEGKEIIRLGSSAEAERFLNRLEGQAAV